MKPALCLLLLCFASGARPQQGAGPAIVCWQENRKLTWADFQAEALPEGSEVDTAYGVSVGAVTEANAVVYELKTEAGKRAGVFVRVEFDPQKSWVNKHRHFDHSAVLAHEQLHFDIAELTGRKIRRLLARCAAQHLAYPAPAVTKQLGELYDAEDRLNTHYDQEAGFGNLKAQARWQAAIKKQLDDLRAYKSKPGDCELPQ
jgi:hypothetical protein